MNVSKRTKYALVASAVLAFAGVAWAASDGASIRPAGANAGTRPKAGRTELVAPARVEAEHDTVSLAFDSNGRVVEVRVREGDHVQAGDVIAKLDDRLPRAHVAKATAALVAARARADAAEHGARPGEVE